jgi:hypothetical protein
MRSNGEAAPQVNKDIRLFVMTAANVEHLGLKKGVSIPMTRA